MTIMLPIIKLDMYQLYYSIPSKTWY